MLYPLVPVAMPLEPYAWADGVFSANELDALQSQALSASEAALVGHDGTVNPEIRRSNVKWLGDEQNTRWVFERLASVCAKLNAEYFRFDLTGFGEKLQLTNYDHSEHGMYGWHHDYNSTVSRKLSVVVQLTDPSEFEGGNLEIAVGGKTIVVKKQRGLVVVFPAFNLHQVTPVTRGSRQTLVAWVSGPAFR